MGTLAGATEGVFFLSLVSLIESKDVSKSVSELRPPRDKTDGGPWLKETWDILERSEGETARGLGGGVSQAQKGTWRSKGRTSGDACCRNHAAPAVTPLSCVPSMWRS